MSEYEGHYDIACDFCDDLATHICLINDRSIFVCRLHFIRTKVEHLASNHTELKAYTKYKHGSSRRTKTTAHVEASGMF